MSEKIIPTPGRVVWYYPSAADGLSQFSKGTADAQPLTGFVAAVHADNMVNLCVLDAYGNTHARLNVFLVQPGTPKPDHAYCAWMPYQVKAAGIELPVVEAPAPASDTPEGDSVQTDAPDADAQQTEQTEQGGDAPTEEAK